MQLIMATDYAIRALLYLAVVERMATAAEVAEEMKVPRQYLVTMSRKLKDADLIGAEPGVSGGYYLLRPPEEISLLDIIRVTEGTTKLNRCLEHDEYCSRLATESCPVREVYEELQSTVESLLGGVTLADLKRRMREERGGVNQGYNTMSER